MPDKRPPLERQLGRANVPLQRQLQRDLPPRFPERIPGIIATLFARQEQ